MTTSWALSMSARDGTITSHLVDGWDIPDDGGRAAGYVWSTGTSVRMILPRPARATRLTLDLIPFTADGHIPFQDVWAYADGRFSGFARMMQPGLVTCLIDAPADEPVTMTLTMVLPNAAVPADLGIADDRRRLGVALRSIAYA